MAHMGDNADDIAMWLESTDCRCNEGEGVCDACTTDDEIERLRQENADILASIPHIVNRVRRQDVPAPATGGLVTLQAALDDFLTVQKRVD